MPSHRLTVAHALAVQGHTISMTRQYHSHRLPGATHTMLVAQQWQAAATCRQGTRAGVCGCPDYYSLSICGQATDVQPGGGQVGLVGLAVMDTRPMDEQTAAWTSSCYRLLIHYAHAVLCCAVLGHVCACGASCMCRVVHAMCCRVPMLRMVRSGARALLGPAPGLALLL